MKTTTGGFTTYYRLLGYLRQYWWWLLLGAVCTAMASGIAAGFTWFLKPLLNKGFINPNLTFIHWIPFIIIAAYLTLSGSAFLGDYWIARVSRYVIMNLQRILFKKYQSLPLSYFQQNSAGQLVAKLIYNAEQVAEAATKVVITVLQDLFYLISLVVVMLSNSLLLTVVFLCSLPFTTVIVAIAGKIMKRLSLEVQDAVGEVAHIAKESIEGAEVIGSFGGREVEREKFFAATWRECRKQIKVVVANSTGTAAARVVGSIVVAVSVYLATSSSHSISAGAFMSTLAAMLGTLRPIRNLTSVNSQLQKGIAGAESIFEVLDEEEELNRSERKVGRVAGEICYKQVDFHYPGERKPALQNVSFKVEAGESVAIVGRSGSGKSTLVSLLPRFYDIQTGEITVDGVSIHEFELTSLREQFSIVSQRVMLFDDTIAGNIAYGSMRNASEKEVYKAAEAAHAVEFISELPKGFATVVGENGVLLSVGQRQRLAIARAFLKNAPILILDEATSGLDAESECYIQQALSTLMQDRTTLVIAHRLSTIKNSAKILVLDRGRVVEIGSHDELLAQNGLYTKLYRKVT